MEKRNKLVCVVHELAYALYLRKSSYVGFELPRSTRQYAFFVMNRKFKIRHSDEASVTATIAIKFSTQLIPRLNKVIFQAFLQVIDQSSI